MKNPRTAQFNLCLSALFLVLNVHAGENAPEVLIRETVKRNFPEYTTSDIRESLIPGLYEVVLGSEVVYMSADGRYIIQGNMYDLQERVNLSEKNRESARMEALQAVPVSEIIEFAPEHPSWTIYVFTDIECSFCRRFHQDIKKHNANGIAVRYLAFPRSGIGSETYHNMVSIWCAKDRQAALTNAKLDTLPDRADCDNPVSRHYQLGQDVGVQGTPAVYTEQGVHIGGYLSPEELLEAVQGS